MAEEQEVLPPYIIVDEAPKQIPKTGHHAIPNAFRFSVDKVIHDC